MQINVTFRHIEPSEALREYVEEKISRVNRLVDQPMEAHVTLKVEKFRHTAEVTVDVNGMIFNGEEQTEDMYSAIDLVADNIEGQIKKNRDKVRRRKQPGPGRGFPVETGSAQASVYETDDERRVIRTEQYYAKPMDVDEAVMQLSVSNGEFIVFNNRSSNRINVLYRRKDGHYGLIEPL